MDNETDIAIAVRDLTVRYKNGHTALHNASFSIKKGTISGLVGVNGAGKSTLFKALMGFVPIAKGDITILGNPVSQALKSRLIAYVPQSEEVDWSFLHDEMDSRQVSILTDDERPLVTYDGKHQTIRGKDEADG